MAVRNCPGFVIDLQEAKRLGYTACSVCKPPLLIIGARFLAWERGQVHFPAKAETILDRLGINAFDRLMKCIPVLGDTYAAEVRAVHNGFPWPSQLPKRGKERAALTKQYWDRRLAHAREFARAHPVTFA